MQNDVPDQGSISEKELYEKILDESNQYIEIASKKDYKLIYANKTFCKSAALYGMDYHGMECYKYSNNFDEPCKFCPLGRLKNGEEIDTEFTKEGRTFHIKIKNINWLGTEAFLQYATDITMIKRAQEDFENQMKILVQSIPDAQGIFRFNLTDDKWLSSMGASGYISQLQNFPNVDVGIKSIADYIPITEMRENFIQTFCRENLIKTYNSGVPQIVKEVRSYYDDGSIRWARMTARLNMNPLTGKLECIIYGMDISGEKEYQEKIALEKKEKNVILEKSKRDVLTGLYSKTAFEEILTNYINNDYDEEFALIFMDIDHFKNINDTFGHMSGDELIIRASIALKEIFDDMDILARFGGDEFCIISRKITEKSLALKLEHVLERFDRNISEDGKIVHISTSIGVALGNIHKSGKVDGIKLLRMADDALYASKRAGRNRYTQVLLK